MAYLIRPMEKGDLGQVNEIDREAFPSQWPIPNYRQELQNRLARYLVAIDDSQSTTEIKEKSLKKQSGLATWLARWLKPGVSHDESPSHYTRQYIVGFSGIWLMVDEAHVTNVAVRQEYRRKGIGELLLIATIDLARDLKASRMTLEVRISNIVAQNLYGKYGFAQAGIRRGYYLDNKEDAMIMTTDDIHSPNFLEHIRQLRESLARKLS